MNSYTLISSKNAIKLFFFLFVLFLFISSIFIWRIDVYFTDRGYFIEHKISKASHMLNDAKKEKHDMIFIGHSKIQYHINSDIFSSKGINIYTYGIPSITISDYPYMVQKAIEAKPKTIVLDIPVQRLYRGFFLPTIVNPTWYDLYEHGKATNLVALPKNLYDFIPLKFYFSRYKDLIYQVKNKDDVEKVVKGVLEKYNAVAKCNNFFYRGKTRIVTLCTNGNGTIWADNKTAPKKFYELTDVNSKQVQLINYLIKKIQSKGIKVLLLLEATSYNREVHFNANTLYSKFNVDAQNIIDITQFQFEDKLWADNGHLNAIGKMELSSHLLKLIQKIKSIESSEVK